MGSALFIVWRESIEAILVVGILYAWIRERGEGRIAMRDLWAGVALGVALALLLALGILGVQTQLAGTALDVFQVTVVFAAAALIVQMVFWMRRNARGLKRELEEGMQQAVRSRSRYAAALLAAAAVAREGSETVLFLYGLAMEHQGLEFGAMLGGACAGFVLALGTAWLIGKLSRLVSWKSFFQVTEVLLLLLGAALVAGGVDKLIALGWLPALADNLWDTTPLLDDASPTGSLVAGFTGYRAQPCLSFALAYGAYWLVVWLLSRASGIETGRPTKSTPAPASSTGQV